MVLPPARPLTTAQMDEIYALPFTRRWHPRYDRQGGIPALEAVRFSITTHRGCFGGCNFCSLYFHQGKTIASRSLPSIIAEMERCRALPEFRGTFSDIGGPTANMYGMSCGKAISDCGLRIVDSKSEIRNPKSEMGCTRPSCLFPSPCRFLQGSAHELLRELLRWRSGPGQGCNIFIASGVRYDLALRDREYLQTLVRHFVGGHLKVAPEHYDPQVLRLMGKPDFELFRQFEKIFAAESAQAGKEQYLVPYFISGFPGSGLAEALNLGEYLLERGWKLRQVQDFTPIPLTLATALFVSGAEPARGNAPAKKLHVARGRHEKQLQMAILRYHEPESQKIIREFLRSPAAAGLSSALRERLKNFLSRLPWSPQPPSRKPLTAAKKSGKSGPRPAGRTRHRPKK